MSDQNMFNSNEEKTEKEFEKDILDALPEIPPADILKKVIPCRRAMNFIIAGFALTTITINFFALNYILPAMGLIFLFLGFRTLRYENSWFKYCWITSGIQIAINVVVLFVDGSVYRAILEESHWTISRVILQTVLQIFLLVFFAEGLRELQKKAGVKQRTGCIILMMVWYLMAAFLSVSDAGLVLTPILFVVVYIFLLISLKHISNAVNNVGYEIKTAPVKFSDKRLGVILGIVAILSAVSGCVLFSTYPMEWVPVEENEHSQVENIKSHLLELGFPENILNDLSADDIKQFLGAQKVSYSVWEYSLDKIPETDNGDGYRSDTDMVVTDIIVKLPGERTKWRVVHHFYWRTDPGFCGTETIQLWTPERDDHRHFMLTSEITGRVLYDNGATYTAPYYSVTSLETINNYAPDVHEAYADFSMPQVGDSKRCYVTYECEQGAEQFLANGWAFYYHQNTLLQYPECTASEFASGDSLYGWNFEKIQTEVMIGDKSSD